MKHFFKLLSLSLVLVFVLNACKKKDVQPTDSSSCENPSVTATVIDDTVIVHHDEEDMPLWLHGKSTSNTVILIVHGGPGSDVMDYRNYKGGLGFRRLENNYIVAYWQQRASGLSQGPDNTAYYTIPQYAEDCEVVVDSLIARYPGKQIVMMGHSWGGMLTSYYLRTATRRAKITAWVDIDGVHNGTILFEKSAQDLNTAADERIALGENVNYWTYVKQQVASGNNNTINALSYDCVEYIDQVPVKVPRSDFTFTPRAIHSNQNIFPVLVSTNNNSYLPSYTLPTLVLWGKYDYSVSKQIRDQLLNLSGSSNLVSVEFSASSHLPMFQEPDAFAEAIENFIEGL